MGCRAFASPQSGNQMSSRASGRCRREHERLLIVRWDIVGLLRDLTARDQHPGVIALRKMVLRAGIAGPSPIGPPASTTNRLPALSKARLWALFGTEPKVVRGYRRRIPRWYS